MAGQGLWYTLDFPGGPLDLLHAALDFLRKLTQPAALNAMAMDLGGWLYVVLFAIIFVETGLVVMPFLPGDSLLFAIGAVAGLEGSPINIWLMGLLLWVAAVLGDAVNYAVGKRLGPAVFHRDDSRWLNKDHLRKAHAFYEKYGGKTIILARFVPIVRTFAPFVAGVGTMSYPKFALYNVAGGALWVGSLLAAGWLFGGIPWVQRNFETVIVAIIVISVLPGVVEYFRSRAQARRDALKEG